MRKERCTADTTCENQSQKAFKTIFQTAETAKPTDHPGGAISTNGQDQTVVTAAVAKLKRIASLTPFRTVIGGPALGS